MIRLFINFLYRPRRSNASFLLLLGVKHCSISMKIYKAIYVSVDNPMTLSHSLSVSLSTARDVLSYCDVWFWCARTKANAALHAAEPLVSIEPVGPKHSMRCQ